MEYGIECALCGKEFIATSKLRKYCDECSPKQDSEKKRLAKAYAQSKRHTQPLPEIIDYTCEECGRNFCNVKHLVYKINKSSSLQSDYVYFCSPKCKKKYIFAHTKCVVCNRLLSEVPMSDIVVKNEHANEYYCSRECQNALKHQSAVKKFGLKKCQECGKEFASENKYFCSKKCKDDAISKGWVSPLEDPVFIKTPEENNKSAIKKREVCVVCKKVEIVKYTDKEFEERTSAPNTVYLCSKRCQDILEEERQKYKELVANKR